MKKKLTLEDLVYICSVYNDILEGIQTRTDVTEVYYKLYQDNVPEEQRVVKIINWMTEHTWEELYNKAKEGKSK